MADHKSMPVEEFQSQGFLQEANRQFFHPHGLALEVETGFASEYVKDLVDQHPQDFLDEMPPADAVWEFVKLIGLDRTHLAGVWDCRDDPEGVMFGSVDAAKAAEVGAERARHLPTRVELMGTVIQPLDYVPPATAKAM